MSGGGAVAVPGILNVLTGAAGAPASGGTSGAGQTQDLIRLLLQAGEQIDQPKEIEIGRQLAAVLLGSKPLHPDLLLQRYVNRLGRWISLQSSRPDLPWTFGVLNDDGFNAFAAPGGYVFVTKGLLDRIADEAELAGILAHEIHHVTEKHHLKALRKTAQAGLLTHAISSQLTGSLGSGLSSQVLGMGREIYAKGLDQSDEYEADRQGVALAARAGFEPYGLVFVLNQLRTVAADNSAFLLTMSTHPPAQQRLDQLEAAMGKRLDTLSGRPSVTLAQRLAR
jgi:predicted Zn-dependent protease